MLVDEGNYLKSARKEMEYRADRMYKCAAPRMMMEQHESYGACLDDMLFGGGGAGRRRNAVTLQRKLNSHNNFLSNVGHLTSNISETK